MIVRPTLEAFLEFLIHECPDVVPQIAGATEKYLAAITDALDRCPYVPASTMEATLEEVAEVLCCIAPDREE